MEKHFYIRKSDIEQYKEGFNIDYLKKEPITVKTYTNVLVLPSEDVKPLSRKIQTRKGILLGNLRDCWGHNIMDDILRIWYTFTDEYTDKVNQGFEIFAFKLHKKPFSRNFIQLIALLGIDINNINIITEPTGFTELIIPEKSIVIEKHERIGRYYYPEYKQMIKRIISQIPINQNVPEKIYFSRSHLSINKKFNFMGRKGRDIGEKEIEKAFSKMGFTIIYPEQKTLEEQIQLLQGCKCFATTEGSIAHNLIFATSGITAIVLRKSYYFNTYQSMIVHLVEANMTYIDAHKTFMSIRAPWNGPFHLCITKHFQQYARSQGYALKNKLDIANHFIYLFEATMKAIRHRVFPKFL